MKLEDIVFANFTKVYISADDSFESDKSTLVVTGNSIYYLTFDSLGRLFIHYQFKPTISLKRWQESSISTYDELVNRVNIIQILGGV